jgi:hypothetical protein
MVHYTPYLRTLVLISERFMAFCKNAGRVWGEPTASSPIGLVIRTTVGLVFRLWGKLGR